MLRCEVNSDCAPVRSPSSGVVLSLTLALLHKLPIIIVVTIRFYGIKGLTRQLTGIGKRAENQINIEGFADTGTGRICASGVGPIPHSMARLLET